jgi:hypothetical protein
MSCILGFAQDDPLEIVKEFHNFYFCISMYKAEVSKMNVVAVAEH